MRDARQRGPRRSYHQVIAFLDACYRPAASVAAWLREVARTGDTLLGDGLGVAAAGFPRRSIEPACIELESCDPRWPARFLARVVEREDLADAGDPLAEASRRIHEACRSLGGYASLRARPNALFEHAVSEWDGARDLVSVHAWDEHGQGVWLGIGRRRKRPLSIRDQQLCALAAHHLGNALRLRHAGPRVASFASSGALLDGAAIWNRRDVLAEAVKAVERERERIGGVHYGRTVLVDGRPWTVASEDEAGGRRRLVLMETDGAAARIGRLTPRERQVLSQCARGHHTKLVAYEIGISPTTVRVLLGRAARKLGVATRGAALDLYRRYGDAS